MGKHFWPIYIAVASVSSALVWRFAPALGACLPPDVQRSIRNAVEATTARFAGNRYSGDGSRDKPAPPDTAVQEFEQSVANRGKSAPSAAVEPDSDTPPARRGVLPVDSLHATWGVLTRVTSVEDLDGKVVAKLSGGRFFKIKKTISTPSGPMLTGRFLPQKRPGDVRVSIGSVNCLSGFPSYLSTNQQVCLRKYYELTGEAEALKEKLIWEAVKKSPYLQDAADAQYELQKMEKSIEKLKRADADTRRKATYELSQLRVKAQELNQKHKDWKEEHATELPDPEKDPGYIELLRQREKYREPIKDLLFASS